PEMRALYLDAEAEDAYYRDRNVFAPGVTIEDDMAVLARYSNGATMTYHLTAYSPWEGYRVMFNGSRGRLELDVVENDFVNPHASGDNSAALHGEQAAAESGSASLTLRPFWSAPRQVPVPGYGRDGHGGGDDRMTAVLFGGEPDPLGRTATARDGALALLTGLAANRSFETNQPVRIADLLALA
ncbi:MAG TPA: Gfo/Idh/MocA family oxidoreductase, partial [Rugosimonospora sp.]|nr:Gfo/Idh/MocA family oxidoreductase [Rugosimonospora sp.]